MRSALAGAQRDDVERRAFERRFGLTRARPGNGPAAGSRRPRPADRDDRRGRGRTRRSGPARCRARRCPRSAGDRSPPSRSSARCTPTCVPSHSRPCCAQTETSSAASRNSTSASLASVVITTWVRCPRFCGVCRGPRRDAVAFGELGAQRDVLRGQFVRRSARPPAATPSRPGRPLPRTSDTCRSRRRRRAPRP